MKNILKNKWGLAFLTLVIGLLIGLYINTSTNQSIITPTRQHINTSTDQVWTCSMHPQIRKNEPGDCPICGMELIPVTEAGNNTLYLKMSEEAMRLADIQTSKVELTKPEKEIFMQGKVKIDERRVSIITSRFSGRIEKLFVDFTGIKVEKGQKLASLYSPELITAQQELFEALKYKDDNPVLYQAARNKLKLWNITEQQIVEIESNGQPKQEIDILSPLSGIVTQRMATLGDYVKEGSKLFEVVDLSKVWIVFDAYESDIPWIRQGDKIDFKIGALTAKSMQGKIAFIDPIVNPKTRTTSVRIDFSNTNEQLKPEMFAEGRLTAHLPLKKAKIIVPKSAVLWTGKRSVVYIKIPETNQPTFQFREITTGLDLGTHYIVEEGLAENELVVTNGVFKVDAASQLAGKKSMMNPAADNGKSSTGHHHGDMKKATMDKLSEAKFKVDGNCEMCQNTIEKAASNVQGVQHVTWDKNSKIFTMHYSGEETTINKVSEAIANAGYSTEYHKENKKAYKDLPSCCQYKK